MCKNEISKDIKSNSGEELKLGSPVLIEIAKDFNNNMEFRLSEIADDIKYVKLEKTPKSLIGGSLARSSCITDKYIFTTSHEGLLQFYKNGKFFRLLVRKGRGPQEAEIIKGLTFNKSKHTIYVATYNKVLSFNFEDGEFLGSFPINSNIVSLVLKTSFIMLNENTFVALSDPVFQFQPDYTLIEIFDAKGNRIKIKSSLYSITNDDRRKINYQAFNSIWYFDNQYRLYEGYNDTIYSIKANRLSPAYIFKFGKFKGSFDEIAKKHFKILNKCIQVINFLETNNYLFFRFFYNENFFIGQYDKINQKFYRLTNPNGEFSAKIYNDIDGGMPINPWSNPYDSGGELYKLVDAVVLKEQLTNEYLENSEAKYPEKKEQLKKFLGELSIDDNPILVITKLKTSESK